MGGHNGNIKVAPGVWTTSSAPVKTGSSDSHDMANDVVVSIHSLLDSLNAVGFLTSSKNLATALDDFGSGMAAALACVAVDLEVVASGLTAAAHAFTALDGALASTFTQLENQLGYYTNYATSLNLATPTAAEQAALNSLTLSSASSSSATSGSSGFTLSSTTVHFVMYGSAAVGTGVVIYLGATAAAAIDWAAVGTGLLELLGLAAAF